MTQEVHILRVGLYGKPCGDMQCGGSVGERGLMNRGTCIEHGVRTWSVRVVGTW